MDTRKVNISQMLAKLDSLYDEEEKIVKQIQYLNRQYAQLQEDKEMLQTMIMYASNKKTRQY